MIKCFKNKGGLCTRLELGPTTNGDTWYGFHGVALESDGVTAMDLTGASLRSRCVRQWTDEASLFEASSGDGITITDAALGQFQVDPRIIDLDQRYFRLCNRVTLRLDVVATEADGTITTIAGGTLTVTSDVTR